jgi:hypothetical protein
MPAVTRWHQGVLTTIFPFALDEAGLEARGLAVVALPAICEKRNEPVLVAI